LAIANPETLAPIIPIGFYEMRGGIPSIMKLTDV